MLLLCAPQTFIKNRGYYRRGLFAQMTSTRRNKKSRFIIVVINQAERTPGGILGYISGFRFREWFFSPRAGSSALPGKRKSFLHWRVQCDNTVSCDSLFRVSNFPAIFNRSLNMNEKSSSGISQHATPGS